MPSAVSSQLGSFWSQGLGVPILQGLLTQIFYFKVNNTVIEKNISSFNKGASLLSASSGQSCFRSLPLRADTVLSVDEQINTEMEGKVEAM